MTSEIADSAPRARGRPPGFDRNTALRAAMLVFWERGYEGSTFDDLTAAMEINASSFRNSFKSKERLYREATDAYLAETGAWFADVLAGEPDVRAAFKRLLEEAAAHYTRSDMPPGCMISLAAAHTPPALQPLKEMMSAHRLSAEAAMAQRLRQGQAEGQLATEVDIEALAAFLSTAFRGMALQARDGASRSRLVEIANIAMNAFPAPPA